MYKYNADKQYLMLDKPFEQDLDETRYPQNHKANMARTIINGLKSVLTHQRLPGEKPKSAES